MINFDQFLPHHQVQNPGKKAMTLLSPTKQPITKMCPRGPMWFSGTYLPRAESKLNGLFSPAAASGARCTRKSMERCRDVPPHQPTLQVCMQIHTDTHSYIAGERSVDTGYEKVNTALLSTLFHSPFPFSRRHLSEETQHIREGKEPGRQETAHIAFYSCWLPLQGQTTAWRPSQAVQDHTFCPGLGRRNSEQEIWVKTRQMSDTIN